MSLITPKSPLLVVQVQLLCICAPWPVKLWMVAL